MDKAVGSTLRDTLNFIDGEYRSSGKTFANINPATGKQYSVREFIYWTAAELGISLRFEGEGVNEKGIVESINGDRAPALKPGDCIVAVDARYFRPAEVETLLGDPTKAKEKLGWTPTTTLEELVTEMVATDKEEAAKEALLRRKGFAVVGSMENPPTIPRAD
jgi:GDPmannose 4,6-dehydratase